MNGRCDLIIPSTRSISMNLQEESTIKFIENTKMEIIIKLKGKISKVDLTGTEVYKITVNGTIPLEIINTDKHIFQLNVTTPKLTMINSLNVRWLTINADTEELDLAASNHCLNILHLYSNEPLTKLTLPEFFGQRTSQCNERIIDIKANIDKLDLTNLENQEVKELTLITHAPSTQLLLPQIEGDNINRVINKPSIGYLKHISYTFRR